MHIPKNRAVFRIVRQAAKAKYVPGIILLLFTVCGVGGSRDAGYDGKWLLSVNERQRLGFEHGFILCYSQLVDRSLFRGSYSAFSVRLVKYLRAHPEALSESVDALMLSVAALPHSDAVQRTSEGDATTQQLNVKWGPYEDGDEWRAGGPWNLGYIQGFLECYKSHTKSEYGTFSKSPEWYVRAISDWYGVREGNPDVINTSRQDTKIPEVLFRFRDGSNGESTR